MAESAAALPRGREAVAVPGECTACGACCFSDEPGYIEVFHHDAQRMGAQALALTQVSGHRRFMRFEHGRCAALEGDPGAVRCAIYPERPDACRWLERGSGACREQLAQGREIVLIRLRRG